MSSSTSEIVCRDHRLATVITIVIAVIESLTALVRWEMGECVRWSTRFDATVGVMSTLARALGVSVRELRE